MAHLNLSVQVLGRQVFELPVLMVNRVLVDMASAVVGDTGKPQDLQVHCYSVADEDRMQVFVEVVVVQAHHIVSLVIFRVAMPALGGSSFETTTLLGVVYRGGRVFQDVVLLLSDNGNLLPTELIDMVADLIKSRGIGQPRFPDSMDLMSAAVEGPDTIPVINGLAVQAWLNEGVKDQLPTGVYDRHLHWYIKTEADPCSFRQDHVHFAVDGEVLRHTSVAAVGEAGIQH